MSTTSIPAKDSTDEAAALESDRLMVELSVTHGGRYYYYDGYRYDRLADAIAYAQLPRARQSERTESSAVAQLDAVEPPNAADGQLMCELAISFENGSFIFEGFRYDRLIDAANYARHRRQLGVKAR